MNTPEELHAFVIGLCEVLAPWRPSTDIGKCGDGPLETVRKEYHYYSFGRAMGAIAWLIIAKIIQEVFF